MLSDAQMLQMQNQQHICSLLQSRLERVRCSTSHSACGPCRLKMRMHGHITLHRAHCITISRPSADPILLHHFNKRQTRQNCECKAKFLRQACQCPDSEGCR